jgi:pimeloyl-ACP methyl ester carboxylesterase
MNWGTLIQTPTSGRKFVDRKDHDYRRHAGLCVGLWLAIAACVAKASAATLLLKDGRTLAGRYAEVASVAENLLSPKGPAGEVALTPLLVIDDGLRRTYIHSFQVRQVLEQNTGREVRINIWQPVAERGGGVGRIGRALRVTPFDEYGRRIYEMQSTDGLLSVVQGITQVTPLYTRVQGLTGGARPIVWDMRIATSSIPRETLSRILSNSVKPEDLEGRLQIVRLYLESERYRDAANELQQILKDFPERADLERDIRQLRQLGARLILKEIELRAKAGQHELARGLLNQFPAEGVAGETLQQVREMLQTYAAADEHRKRLAEDLDAQVARIGDPNGRRLAEEFAREITAELNEDAIARLASFERLADDGELSPDQKVALAMSGWLVGANDATDNFQVAVSLADVRDKVRQYLREPLAAERANLLSQLRDIEGATVERVAQILKLMKPPLDELPDGQQAVAGVSEAGHNTYELRIPSQPGHADGRYLVQLPPEYDSLRHYPTIVALSDSGVTPEQMLDYWCGLRDEKKGERMGQATRHGYIVIAVDWQRPHQFTYDYSVQEHQAVLTALRDACRRFAVDTDRVFLAGHGIGGDAAWDMGVAHPDIWAGVIPIVAVAERYVGRYAKNAPYVPWYMVAGELDADKMAHNARELDRYLKPNTDVTIVEYLGRGYEPFGDEIQRLFDWMGRRRRAMPKEIDCVSMRPWDNFFWWLEAEGLPGKSMVAPENWPPGRGARPARLRGQRLAVNKVSAFVQAEKVTIWLAPELVDLKAPLQVEVNNRSIGPRDRLVRPDLGVLLEDVRTRADRQHPFWAKLSTKGEGGRGRAE